MKFAAVSNDHALVVASEATARGLLGTAVSATRSANHILDVNDPFANKGQVVAAFGDMPNDVLMFRKCGFSIAMGNASDAVKAQASAVTDSNEDEGFAKAVRRFVLPPGTPAGERS